MITERGAAEAAQAIVDRLAARGYEHAIGGALALAVAGVPRGTADVDVNVFVGEDEIDGVVEALNELGVVVDRDEARAPSWRRAGRVATRDEPTAAHRAQGA